MASLFESIDKKVDKLSDNFSIKFEAKPLFIAALVVILASSMVFPQVAAVAIKGALFSAPVWLPFLVVGGAIDMWYILKQSEFLAKQKYILLEIKPPRELVKTPLAMEAFISTLHLTGGESNWWQKINGGMRPHWSLEIASFEGQVHFFIWGRASFRRLVESQLYAQYPGIQVVEAVDYTRTISARPEEWFVWGVDFKALDSDPLPIKTYVEYGLEKTQKEPEQIDPLANLIEFMGSIGKGENLWLQYVIRAHKGEKYHKLNKEGKPFTWADEGKELIEKIRAKTRDPYTDPATGEERPGFPNPTKGQSEKIAAIERNTGKFAFDVGIRAVYLTKPDKVNAGTITHLIALYKPFTNTGWNGLDSTAWMKNFNDYPWDALWTNRKKDHYRRELVEAYRRRQYFYHPRYEGALKESKTIVMSTEELATVYHIPSRSVETPGLGRIASTTSEAPVNLPI